MSGGQESDGQGQRGGIMKGQQEGSLCDRTALCLDCITLELWLYPGRRVHEVSLDFS